MKVILLKNINGLGQRGEIKEVSDGYARNYLLPQKMAEQATDNNIQKVKTEQQTKEKMAVRDLLATEKLAEKLNNTYLEIKSKVNDSGRLYAAITNTVIVKKLKEQGISLEKNNIILLEPIKELGDFLVSIKLDHGLEAEINLSITE